MKIIIDTELRAIIVPNTYSERLERLNRAKEAEGGERLDERAYVRACFEAAMQTRFVRQCEAPSARARKADEAKVGRGIARQLSAYRSRM